MRKALALTALGVLTISGLTEAPVVTAAPARLAADTTDGPAPSRFRKTVFFNPVYLTRAAEAARDRYRAPEAVAETEPVAAAPTAPTAEAPSAAVYASRYGITRDLAQKILDVARDEGIDPELGFRLVRVESRFQPRARGPQGALGLTQLMPGTARSIDRSVRSESEVLNPTTNLRLGFRYLRQMIERYDGDVRLGLLAYNRGEGAVDRALRRGRDPENGYSRKVLGSYKGKGLLRPSK